MALYFFYIKYEKSRLGTLTTRTKRMTEKELNKFFRDFIFWQQEGLDISEAHCLFINFGVNVKFENSQIRRANLIFSFH